MIALLVNPISPSTEHVMPAVQEAARAKGVQLHILKASTESEIDAAFAALVQRKAGGARRLRRSILLLPAVRSSRCWQHAMLFPAIL